MKERFSAISEKPAQIIHDRSVLVLEKAVEYQIPKKIIRKVSGYLFEKGEKIFRYNGLDKSIEQTNPLLRDGYKLVFLSSHKSHGDISPGLFIMDSFIDGSEGLLTECNVLVSESMAGGQQGSIIQTLYEETIVPNSEMRRVKTIPVVTDNDVAVRGLQQNKMGGGLKIVRELRKKNSGFFVFIEGSIKGGRENPETGDIFGLQNPDSLLVNMIEYAKEKNIALAFVLIGMEKTHKLFTAEGKFFTPDLLKALLRNKKNPDATFSDINVSTPITIEPNSPVRSEQIADNLMIGLASQLNDSERGIFKNADYLLRT